jgi:hypothetical protein
MNFLGVENECPPWLVASPLITLHGREKLFVWYRLVPDKISLHELWTWTPLIALSGTETNILCKRRTYRVRYELCVRKTYLQAFGIQEFPEENPRTLRQKWREGNQGKGEIGAGAGGERRGQMAGNKGGRLEERAGREKYGKDRGKG